MNKKITSEIRRMAETIPEDILGQLMTQVPSYSTLNELVEKGLADPDTAPKLKDRLQNIKDSGLLNQKDWVVNKEAEVLLDKWWDEELKKAQDEGRLPKLKKGSGTLKELKKKGKQYARRSNKKSKGESGKREDQAGDSESVLS